MLYLEVGSSCNCFLLSLDAAFASTRLKDGSPITWEVHCWNGVKSTCLRGVCLNFMSIDLSLKYTLVVKGNSHSSHHAHQDSIQLSAILGAADVLIWVRFSGAVIAVFIICEKPPSHSPIRLGTKMPHDYQRICAKY